MGKALGPRAGRGRVEAGCGVERCCIAIRILRRYNTGVIRSNRDKRVDAIRAGAPVKGFPPDLVKRTQRKLAQLDAAERLVDLSVPPSNRLERLRGDREGQHSIRINDQFRICFVWRDGEAHDVEIVDHH
ncbi:MAG: type II toxin-antitoxin system RelE/ParE family toxin [Rhizobiaceae bacterium]|nr:type II toxin-antitoxin system RelE/ParE family toxin [Rhizobiaceae bacterium]